MVEIKTTHIHLFEFLPDSVANIAILSYFYGFDFKNTDEAHKDEGDELFSFLMYQIFRSYLNDIFGKDMKQDISLEQIQKYIDQISLTERFIMVIDDLLEIYGHIVIITTLDLEADKINTLINNPNISVLSLFETSVIKNEDGRDAISHFQFTQKITNTSTTTPQT